MRIKGKIHSVSINGESVPIEIFSSKEFLNSLPIDPSAQTKLESMIESFCNNGSAFIISVCLWHWVVGPLWDAKILTNAFEVTTTFTVVSFIRSYLWRRFFNSGLHRLVHKGASDAYRYYRKSTQR